MSTPRDAPRTPPAGRVPELSRSCLFVVQDPAQDRGAHLRLVLVPSAWRWLRACPASAASHRPGVCAEAPVTLLGQESCWSGSQNSGPLTGTGWLRRPQIGSDGLMRRIGQGLGGSERSSFCLRGPGGALSSPHTEAFPAWKLRALLLRDFTEVLWCRPK